MRLYSPNRREVTLVLFSVMIFVIFYNFDATFDLANTLSGSSAAGDGIDTDIYGDWVSEDIHVSSIHKQQEEKEVNADDETVWIKSDIIPEVQKQVIFGNTYVNDGFLKWDLDIPQTKLVKHAPGRVPATARRHVTDSPSVGFSILDDVIVCNGTIFIVTDDFSSFPPLGSIASSVGNPYEAPRPGEWEVLSVERARERLGSYGGM